MDNLSQKLRDFRVKITKPRLELLRCLRKQKTLVSARDLYKKIKVIDQSSVYRILQLFEDLSLVHTEIIKKEKLYCLSVYPHHHIICRKCGYTEKFKCLEKNNFFFKNFSNIHHRLTLTGLCYKCKH